MKDFCAIANQNCKQPAGGARGYDVLENIGPLIDILACYRCGESVCTSCGKPWLRFWFCPECFVAQGKELQAVVERYTKLPIDRSIKVV